MKKLFLSCSLALLAVPAFAQDAGPTPCGDVTVQGECNGNVLSFCNTQANELVTVDCGTEYFPEGVTGGTCTEIDAQYGYDCALPTGSTCLFQGQNGVVPVFCASPNDGCVADLATNEAVCTANVPACTQPAQGTQYAPTCSGDLLYLACIPGDQPVAFDCASLNGSCSNNACVVPEGQPCDDQVLLCGDGLTCQNDVCVSGGGGNTPTPDAGTGGNNNGGNTGGDRNDDEDDGDEPPPSGCSSVGAAATAPFALAAFALFGLAVIRRRR